MSAAARPVVAVVGGGITGLAAAWELRQGEEAPDVVVLDGEERLGGRIETVSLAGHPVDTGPDAFLTRNPAAEQLCRELGLGDELIAPAAGAASVYVRGQLLPLPSGLVLGIPTDLGALRRSGVLSRRGVLRVAADLVLPGHALPDGDPSLTEVIAPRIGEEALRVLVEPLIGGINAGSADHLSLAAVAPQVAGPLAGRHSLLRALRPRATAGAAGPRGAGGEDGAGGKPLFLGLAGGLGTLVDRLAERLTAAGVRLRTGTPVSKIRQEGERYVLDAGGGEERADLVVLAVPAHAAAALVAGLAGAAAADLAEIGHASVALVTLVWPANVAGALTGSGFLVPRAEGLLLTAATYTSVKWPRSSVPGRLVLRGSFGHAGDDRIEGLTDAELVARARQEIAGVLDIDELPLTSLVRRFPRSFPQYEPGHLARVARIRDQLAGSHPHVALAGAAYDGIGIPACVAGGRRAAATVLARFGATAPASR